MKPWSQIVPKNGFYTDVQARLDAQRNGIDLSSLPSWAYINRVFGNTWHETFTDSNGVSHLRMFSGEYQILDPEIRGNEIRHSMPLATWRGIGNFPELVGTWPRYAQIDDRGLIQELTSRLIYLNRNCRSRA